VTDPCEGFEIGIVLGLGLLYCREEFLVHFHRINLNMGHLPTRRE